MLFHALDQKTGLWGYIDALGNLAVPCLFRQPGTFREGLAAVQTPDGPDFFIDHGGNRVMEFPRDALAGSEFSEGKALILDAFRYVFIDRHGRTVVPGRFRPGSSEFCEGRASVRVDRETWRYIDHSGRFCLSELFLHTRRYRGGIALVVDSAGKECYIDHMGQRLRIDQYDWLDEFFEGRAAVDRADKRGYVGLTGDLVIPLQFERASDFAEGMAAVRLHGKWGYIDHEGNWLIEPQFSGLPDRAVYVAGSFSEGLAVVSDGERFGYIDRAGAWAVKPLFSRARAFRCGIAQVKDGGRWGWINREGKWIWP